MSSKNFKVKEGLDVGGTVTATGINAPILAEAQIAGVTDTIYYASTKYIADWGADANEEGIRYMTAAGDNRFAVGDVVSVTGMNIAAANVTNKTIVSVSAQEITVFVGAGNTIPRGTTAYDASGQTPTMTKAASTYLTPGTAGQVLKSTGTGVEWGVAGDAYKEVFFLSDGYFSHWSVDGLSWTKTANPGSQDLYDKLNRPGGIASSGSRTVLVKIDAYASNPSQLAFEVNENFYSPSLKSNVLSYTMGDLITQFPNLANWNLYGDNPAIKGVASNGNGTFVISFLRSLNFLVSTDNGSTWQMTAIPTPPAGEGGEGEGGQKPYWNYPTYQFGKFYVTSFGNSSFIESTDGLTWTTVSVPFGMPYSSFEQVYVDAVGNLIAAYDQAYGVVFRSAGDSGFSTSSNSLFQNNISKIRNVGTSFYGIDNQAIAYANFRNSSISSSHNRQIYSNSEISSSTNLITQTASEVLYGAYNFANNQHPMGRIGVYGAHKAFPTSLDTQSDLSGYARSLYIPINIYKKFTGE